MAIALDHCSKVRETELTMAKPTRKPSDPSTGKTTDKTQPKKKRKKNKKHKNQQTEGAGTAPTVTKDKPSATAPKDPPKVSKPGYCFMCGDEKIHPVLVQKRATFSVKITPTRNCTRRMPVIFAGEPTI